LIGDAPRAPVVLAHGLFGFATIHCGPFTLASYFRGVPEFLRARGVRVFTPRIHPTAGIERRARKLAERIEGVFPGEPVHLVGHSLGGLDVRALANQPEWEGRVLSITTVGSPHLGSPLAERARERFGRVYALLRQVGWDHDGFLDVLPDRARAWHDRTPSPPFVPCYHVAGDTPADDVCWPLRATHHHLARAVGANDGLVPLSSASAFGRPLLVTTADHLRQMNWYSGQPGQALGWRVRAMYREILAAIVASEQASLAR
jgi:triacylglycerol lipase